MKKRYIYKTNAHPFCPMMFVNRQILLSLLVIRISYSFIVFVFVFVFIVVILINFINIMNLYAIIIIFFYFVKKWKDKRQFLSFFLYSSYCELFLEVPIVAAMILKIRVLIIIFIKNKHRHTHSQTQTLEITNRKSFIVLVQKGEDWK